MRRATSLTMLAGSLSLCLSCARPLCAEELAPEQRLAVQKGLEYLAKQQHRDGHWEGNGGQYQGAMTALCGMAFLMEGSTIRDGKYTANVRKAVDWMMSHAQNNGMLGNANRANERLGGELEEGADGLLVLRKLEPTPPGFPRRPGLARKRPLA